MKVLEKCQILFWGDDAQRMDSRIKILLSLNYYSNDNEHFDYQKAFRGRLVCTIK